MDYKIEVANFLLILEIMIAEIYSEQVIYSFDDMANLMWKSRIKERACFLEVQCLLSKYFWLLKFSLVE